MLPLRSLRLCLRPVIPQVDIDAIWHAANIPGFTDGLLWIPPASKEQLRKDLEQEEMSASWVPLVIADRNGIVLYGRVFLHLQDDRWSVGYWLLPEFQGNGYATEAVKMAIAYCKKEFNVEYIYADSRRWNEKSANL